MCGIVGLFAKSPEVEARLGEHLSAMLVQMSSRGPDSAGVAVYRDRRRRRLEQAHALLRRPPRALGRADATGSARRSASATSRASAPATRSCVVEARGRRGGGLGSARTDPDLRVMSAGR